MKGWLLSIGMALGLIGAAAALLWGRADWLAIQPLQGEAPEVSRGTTTPSPGVRPAAEPDSTQTIYGTMAQSGKRVPASSNLEPLFTALAISLPSEPLEAPDFTLPDLDGRAVHLRDARGKLVFLNIWATWCPPCRLEMPSMERLYQTFKGIAFAMLAVSIDRQGIEVVKPFMEELQLTFPALLDPKSEVARQYGLRGLSTTYLIDPDGWLIGAAVGGREWSSTEAKALMASLLRQAAARANKPVRGGVNDNR